MNHTTCRFRRCALNLTLPVLIAIVAAAGTVSCVSAPSRDRGSLSDAMDKARDDYDGKREVPDAERTPEPQPDQNESDQNETNQEETDKHTNAGIDDSDSPNATSFNGKLLFAVRGGSVLDSSQEIGTHSDWEILVGGPLFPNLELNAFAGLKAAYPQTGSSLAASVGDSLVFLRAGFEGRFIPLPDWQFLSPYLTAGLGATTMFWDFRNPLISGSETIRNDSVQGLVFFAGAGIYLVRLPDFRIGIGITPEAYLFGPVTDQGFDNDYFGGYYPVEIAGEVGFVF